MDRGELGRFLFTAERFDHAHAALTVLLGLSGLRVSEACGTDIEDLAIERGHRILRIVGKGNKPAVIPLVPRTARTIDLAVGERRDGPILLRRDGQRLDRRTVPRWPRVWAVKGQGFHAVRTERRPRMCDRSVPYPTRPGCPLPRMQADIWPAPDRGARGHGRRVERRMASAVCPAKRESMGP
jgi:integrase